MGPSSGSVRHACQACAGLQRARRGLGRQIFFLTSSSTSLVAAISHNHTAQDPLPRQVDGLYLSEARLQFARTLDGDMSTFFGVNCLLRSSPALTGPLRAPAHITRATCSPTLLLGPLLGSTRCLSAGRTSRHHVHNHQNNAPQNITQRQWRPPVQCLVPQRRTLFGRKSPSIHTHYLYLPPDYKDEEGLPFQKHEDLDSARTARIFRGCSDMNPHRATRLLKILHGRRVAGTLDDPSLHVNTAMFTKKEIEMALSYLREKIPVDEVLNAGLRAEDELKELEAEMASAESKQASVDDAEVAGKVDATEATTTTTTKKASKKAKDNNPRSVYGEGALDRIRASNIARREAEERAEAEQRRREEEAAAQNWGGLAPYDPALHRGLHPKQLEHYEAATSGLEAPPDVPRWRVLLPTTVFAVVVLAALYFVVDRVAPPRPGREIFPSAAGSDGDGDGDKGGGITEAQVVIGAIMLVNVAVFVAWRRVRLWKYLNRHFVLDFVSPRPHQILTAMVTHQDARHLVRTMFLAAAGGSLLIGEVGPVPFLATYAASGVCGFLATLWTHVLRGNVLLYMFGASSAGFGVICAYFWLYRFDGFKILGLPPDPYEGMQGLGIIGLLVSFFALVPMVRGQGGGVDWMSHLAGMLVGMGCASLMEGRWRRARAEKMLQEAERGAVAAEAAAERDVETPRAG